MFPGINLVANLLNCDFMVFVGIMISNGEIYQVQRFLKFLSRHEYFLRFPEIFDINTMDFHIIGKFLKNRTRDRVRGILKKFLLL